MMDPLHPFGQMFTNLHKFKQEDTFTDVVFVVENVKFSAHKAVLASSSPVFRAMFSTKMKEANTNTIILKDTKPDVFSDFLDYIYTMDPTYLKDHTPQFLYLADKYNMEFLAKACDKLIENGLTEHNAVDSLLVADLHRRSELKNIICIYIKKHKRAVRASKGWEKLENNLKLLDEMLQTFLDKDPPEIQSLYSNEFVWTVEDENSRLFHASVKENGKVYRFNIMAHIIDDEYFITIGGDTSGLLINEYSPLAIKLRCGFDDIIHWKSTIYLSQNTTKTFRFLLDSNERHFPFELSLSLSKARREYSSITQYFLKGVRPDAILFDGHCQHTVHRTILAKNKFFAELFGMKHTVETYYVEGVSQETMSTIVRYLYGLNVKNEYLNLDLLRGARKLNVEGLVNECVFSFYEYGKITVKNVLQVYTTAEELGLESLKDAVDTFVKRNANKIVKDGNLEDFKKYPELLEKLFLLVDGNDRWQVA